MNKVILLGRLTKVPEIRYSQTNEMKVAKFTLAVNRQYVKPGEERQTDFLNIIAYSKLAEFVEKYLKQGIQICIVGRIQNRVYTDKNDFKRYITEIIAEEIHFADKLQNTEVTTTTSTTPLTDQLENDTENEIMSNGDDLPF